jgi:murein DD-endopeptidase MepM/ murein hydrolase activator NlpD
MRRSEVEIEHRSSKVTLKKSSLWIMVAAMTVATTWAGGATWYILKKDDFAARMIARDTSRQYAYEDRIAGLRQNIDRLASRQLVDQDGVEARLNDLVIRQSQLETRHAIVAALTDQMNTGPAGTVAKLSTDRTTAASAKPALTPVDPVMSSFMPLTTSKPMPSLEPTALPLPLRRINSDKSAEAQSPWNASDASKSDAGKDATVTQMLASVDRSLSGVDTAQIRALMHVDQIASQRQTRLRSVISDTGLNPDQLSTNVTSQARTTAGQGGPFVPMRVDPQAGPFEAALYRLQPKLVIADRLKLVVDTLPLLRPIGAGAEQSSPFGYRSDPFTRGPAMHTGLDFRAEHGTTVKATAPGKVVTSGFTGGYGNMVEVDHGNGLSTRYAHLSALLVDEGESVTAGTSIGRVGSTGRSTGPHLHYEVRMSEDAVDPQRFLRAGQKLSGLH